MLAWRVAGLALEVLSGKWFLRRPDGSYDVPYLRHGVGKLMYGRASRDVIQNRADAVRNRFGLFGSGGDNQHENAASIRMRMPLVA